MRAARCWRQAQDRRRRSASRHLWDAAAASAPCGDWCIGHRVEDAFVSGLVALALAVA